MSTGRRSNRTSRAPERLGFENNLFQNIPFLSIENSDDDFSSDDYLDTLTESEEEKPPIMEEAQFTPAQKAVVDKAIADAVQAAIQAALASRNPQPSPRLSSAASPVSDRQSRALTADLVPTVDYYLPKLNASAPAVEPSKIKYPKVAFSDNRGEIAYEAWKMDMKLFLEEYSGNFASGDSQVKAYFKCTTGEAKTIILQRMDPDFASDFFNAEHVLRALDQRFHDHNRVQAAKRKYNQLEMGTSSYHKFRNKFTIYATTGKISPSRWFDDMCEKVSPALKQDLRIEKYKMNNNYATLDEFLAIADRESHNIHAESVATNRKATVTFQGSETRGILKDNWRSTSPAPALRFRTPSPTPSTVLTKYPASSTATVDPVCFSCKKPGHYSTDCPKRKKQDRLNKSISELVVGKDIEADNLSENC